MKATIKKEFGNATNHRELKFEGKAEKKVGDVQQWRGSGAKVKGQLTEAERAENP